MDFRTAIPVKQAFSLNHADRIVSFGSCFADLISGLLEENGFRVTSNPFGVLYNPMSVVKSMERLRYGINFKEDELFEYEGIWGSFAHHTSFSGPDRQAVLEHIRSSFDEAAEAFRSATCLMLTFGTSWVYALSETGKIVANCHKLPDYHFTRRRLDVAEIVEYYTEFFLQLFQERPDLKVLLTVSPIRHFKDGAHENTLSKSVLHLAIDELCLRFDRLVYFPSYELMMDDLRDYRFYAEDMLHPSDTAVQYIWERFQDFAFDKPTRELSAQVLQIRRAMAHRPQHPEREDYFRFAQKNLAAVDLLAARHPEIDLSRERSFFSQILS